MTPAATLAAEGAMEGIDLCATESKTRPTHARGTRPSRWPQRRECDMGVWMATTASRQADAVLKQQHPAAPQGCCGSNNRLCSNIPWPDRSVTRQALGAVEMERIPGTRQNPVRPHNEPRPA